MGSSLQPLAELDEQPGQPEEARRDREIHEVCHHCTSVAFVPGRHHRCRESPFLAFPKRQDEIARQSVPLARLRGESRHGASSLVPRPSQCSGAPDQEALKNGPEALKIRSRVSDTHATRPPSQMWLARCGETGLLIRNYRGGRATEWMVPQFDRAAQRRTAMAAQISSTTPNGHAPCRKP